VRPPYEEFLKTDVMLTFEDENALVALDEPYNNFVVIGTHNSCHECAVFGGLCIKAFQYTHASLGEQLRMGIRHIELDIWYNRVLGRWEIFHESVDPLALTHFRLEDALIFLHDWSVKNPNHFPLNFNVDIKGGYVPRTSYLVPYVFGRGLGGPDMQDEVFCKCCAIDVDAQEAFTVLEDLIRKVWSDPAKIFEPSWVLREGETSVGDAIARDGWPNVSKLKGTAMFFLNIYGPKKHLQPEGSGKLFWVREGDTSEDYIYTEAFQGRTAQNMIGRQYIYPADKERLEKEVENGIVLISSDSPASYDHRSVFLRSKSKEDTATFLERVQVTSGSDVAISVKAESEAQNSELIPTV